MDLIRLGDFSIYNAHNETLFPLLSRRFPKRWIWLKSPKLSMEKTDGWKQFHRNGVTLTKIQFDKAGKGKDGPAQGVFFPRGVCRDGFPCLKPPPTAGL
ncbi:MAG: hypothetical protein LBU16_00275 [Treponema sp.]|nr:hypothetical protein [Treponema sp.]